MVSISLASNPLLQEPADRAQFEMVPSAVHHELTKLAYSTDSLPYRSRALFLQLRESIGQPVLKTRLYGLQVMAQRGDPAGARLLAAFLDANTPGARLIPRIHSFTSCRRIHQNMEIQDWTSTVLWNWDCRLHDLEEQCLRCADDIDDPQLSADSPVEEDTPYGLMRRCLQDILATVIRKGDLPPADRSLLVELTRLEVDAYRERVMKLAGRINPFSTLAVARVLPLLTRSDVEIRDLQEFCDWIEAGEVKKAFHHCVPRIGEVMDDRERDAFRRELLQDGELGLLAELHTSLLRNPVPMPRLAVSASRLMALAHQLRSRNLRQSDLDLVTAVNTVQRHTRGDGLRLSLDAELHLAIAAILNDPEPGPGLARWPLSGLYLEGDDLVLRLPNVGFAERIWRDDLPVPPTTETDPELTSPLEALEEVEEVPEQEDVKQLVLRNIDSESMLLGLLSNPKIINIPGLVADIVIRCRSLIVLQMIASDRKLYTGFASQEVPRALLLNPCNIPLRLLRKFIHVKYVSRVDLQGLVKNSTNLRDEVAREIRSYLAFLSR